MKKIKSFIDKSISGLCIMIFSVLVLTVTWQVFTRFILKSPSATSEELAKILFVWLSMFGATILVGEKGHLSITVMKDRIKGKKAIIVDILCEVIILAFAAFVLVGGGYKIVMNGITQVNSTISWLSVGQIYSVVPISGILIIFYNMYSIIECFQKLMKKEGEK